MRIKLLKANEDDCNELHFLQIIAFSDMLSRYKDYDTSPGAENKEKIIERMKQENTIIILLTYSAKISAA